MQDLAERLASLPPEHRALLEQRLRSKGIAVPIAEPTLQRLGLSRAKASMDQERLWFIDRLVGGHPAYNVSTSFLIDATQHASAAGLNAGALVRAVREMVRRHEALRTRFELDGDELLQVVEPDMALVVPLVDLSRLPAERAHRLSRALGLHRARQLFDLGCTPLLRCTLVRVTRDCYYLPVTMHHTVTDHISSHIVAHELPALYAAYVDGRPSPLPEPEFQYIDYSVWQRELWQGETLETTLAYWREQLAGTSGVLDLPTDRPRPAVQTVNGGRWDVRISSALTEAFRDIGRRVNVTPFVGVLALQKLLLSRHCGQRDVIVASPGANRDRVELEQIFGFFLNMLIFRSVLDPEVSFLSLLESERAVTMGAMAHQELPFARLVEELVPERDTSRNALFQVSLIYLEGAEMQSTEGLQWSSEGLGNNTARFDFTLALWNYASGFEGVLEYNSDLFDATTMGRWVGHFECLMRAVVENPEAPIGQLQLWTLAERQQALVEWQAQPRGQTSAGSPGLLDLLARGRDARPDAAALVFGQRVLSHGELWRRVEALAEVLRRRGVGPDVRVGLCCSRSERMVVALLAVLRAGGAYVPLDPSHPPRRLAYVLEDVQASLLLADTRGRTVLGDLLPAALPVLGLGGWDAQVASVEPSSGAVPSGRAVPANGAVPSSQLAYVIYTSGSTGRPKGVQIPRGAMVNFLISMARRPGLAPDDVFAAVTTLAFDIAVLELLLPLLQGATVHVLSPVVSADPRRLARALELSAATVMQATPATWRLLVESGQLDGRLHGQLRVLCGGEALPDDLARRLRLRAAEVWNLFGPTETTVWSAVEPLQGGLQEPGEARVTLGRPIDGTRIHLLDPRRQPVPIGVTGELYIGGAGLARSYHGRAALTAEVFTPDPFSAAGARLYRTGDLARQLADGRLHFLGRRDHQVKVRGFRIELGEIEACLRQLPEVREAVVLVVGQGRGDQRLTAFLVPAHAPARHAGVEEPVPPPAEPPPAEPLPAEPPHTELPAERFAEHLAGDLPPYMIPSAWQILDTLPLTPNGKVDRKALLQQATRATGGASGQGQGRPPSGALEEVLAGIWASTLGIEGVGAEQSFFRLGGHSLLAAQLVSRLRDVLGADVPLNAVFEAPTVAAMARRIGQHWAASVPPLRPLPRDARGVPLEPPPLSFAQQRLWFLDRLLPGNTAYNVFSPLRLLGSLYVDRLHQALGQIVARHEVLRTRYTEPAEVELSELRERAERPPRQVLDPASPASSWPLPVLDLSGLPAERRTAALEDLLDIEAGRVFDLARGPILRTSLVRLAGREEAGDKEVCVGKWVYRDHVLLLSLHHIAVDGWSGGVLLDELARLYAGETLPPLALQYADFALWQRRWLGGEEGLSGEEGWNGQERAAQVDWWRRQLQGAPNLLDLPLDRPRPSLESFQGGLREIRLGRDLRARLEQRARELDATPFMLLLAGWLVLLWRLTGQRDLPVGSAVANRGGSSELERLIGLFVNLLVLRVQVGSGSFEQLLAAVRETVVGAFSHQDLPFEALVDDLRVERSLSHNPLVQVMLSLLDFPRQGRQVAGGGVPGLEIQPLRQELDTGTAKFDLTLFLWPDAAVEDSEPASADWVCALEYNRDLFDATTVARWLAGWRQLLLAAVETPGGALEQLPWFARAERHQLLREWPESAQTQATQAIQASPRYLHQWVEHHAQQRPHAIAVLHRRGALTYGALVQRAWALARRLRALGVGPETRVGVCLGRRPGFLVAVVGVLQAGAAWVPLDPEYPAARLDFLIRDARVQALISEASVPLPSLPPDVAFLNVDAASLDVDAASLDETPADVLVSGLDAEHPAYVIYTSGSTGTPKGVVIPHRALNGLRERVRRVVDPGPADRVLQFFSTSFDASVLEITLALGFGATLHLAEREERWAGPPLARLLAERAPTLAVMPPSALELTPAPGPRSLRTLMIGGEAWTHRLVDAWSLDAAAKGAPRRLLNTYGPAEAAVIVTLGPCPAGRDPLLGGSLPGVRLYVVDPRLDLLPAGVPGELVAGGDGLARGYLARPGLTARAFVPDPFGDPSGDAIGERLYRIGDLVRRLGDGQLDFLGRIDHQVQVRGHRVELGEIEAVLEAQPQVSRAVVLVEPSTSGAEARLVACLVPQLEAAGGEGEAQLSQWQDLFDDLYRGEALDIASASTATFDLVGWESTYTGRAIPEAEMARWLQDTVDGVLALGPGRVLEIGCGTGMVLFRVAPYSGSAASSSSDKGAAYVGTDISAPVLEQLDRRLAQVPDLPAIELQQRAAHDFSGLPLAGFDTVVLNSVAQYFPSVHYLAEVLEGAVAVTRDGGAVFVGDLRSLPLLDAFHASVTLFRADDDVPVATLRRQLEQRRLQENELAVDPAFFFALAEHLPRLRAVEIRPKRGRDANELIRFRYQVVLHVGAASAAPEIAWEDGRGFDLPSLRRRLQAARAAGEPQVAVRDLSNARVAADARLLALLVDRDATTTAGELRRHAGEASGVDPEALCELAEELGYEARLGWSRPGTEGRFESLLLRLPAGLHVRAGCPPLPEALSSQGDDWAAYGNDPGRGARARQLVPELREALAATLPEAMVPASFVLLDALPLTANDKVDRAELARLAAARSRLAGSRSSGSARLPYSELERTLAELWRELLGVERVAVDDNFFHLGGHSLLATQLVSRLHERLEVELPLRTVFEAPVLSELAARLEVLLAAGTRAPRAGLTATAADGEVPLSFAQQRLWFLDRLVPDNPFYNMFSPVQLSGRLDAPALQRTLDTIVRRHAVLRTRFVARQGQARQVIDPHRPVVLPRVDLGRLSESAADGCLTILVQQERLRPFRLDAEWPLRAVLVRRGPESHALLLNVHHIAADGWSMGVFFGELGLLYNGAEPAPLPCQYADFAVWQRQWLCGDNLERQLGYWRRQLADVPPSLDLPFDRPRPAVERFRGGVVSFDLPPATTASVLELAQRLSVTPSMLLLSVYKVLLARLSGQRDLAVGSAIANRTRAEVEDLIGFFVNTLVLRTSLAADTFEQVVARVRDVSLAAYAHQDLPFEMLVEELQVERSLSRNPLCQVMYGFHNFPWRTQQLHGLRLETLETPGIDTGTAKFDLTLFLWQEQPAGNSPFELRASLEFSRDLFDTTTIQRLGRTFRTLTAAAVAAPDQLVDRLPLLAAAEVHALLCEHHTPTSCSTGALGPAEAMLGETTLGETVTDRFAAQVEDTPDAVAVVEGRRAWTYAGLYQRARAWAGELEATREIPAALVTGRNRYLVLGALAALLAGRPYLPLDPANPQERLAQLLEDARVDVLFTRESELPFLPDTQARALVLDVVDSDPVPVPRDVKGAAVSHVDSGSAAYVIYTSGSTGRPKGVVVSHGALLNLIDWHQAEYGSSPRTRTAVTAGPAFDASVWELWPTLLRGGCLLFPPDAVRTDPARLGMWLCRHHVDRVFLATPLAEACLEAWGLNAGGGDRRPRLRTLLTGGDRLHRGAVRAGAALLDEMQLVNHYGPTENAVVATFDRVDAAAARATHDPPIGRPILGVIAHVLDAYQQPVPLGMHGELCLGGASLARGYLHRPARTAGVFVPDCVTPVARDPQTCTLKKGGGRLYRTGDLVRRLADGRLDFLGRFDRQVKVRGVRVELGEIEAVLAAYPVVRQVAVVPVAGAVPLRLAACVVPSTAGSQFDDEPAARLELYEQQVDDWTEMFDEIYDDGREVRDLGLDTVGWNSNYTGEPLSEAEMREWLDDTVERILGLRPRDVLEIGVGTGMVLQRVAPHCRRYLGTDVSTRALTDLLMTLGTAPEPLPVELLQRPAHVFEGLGAGSLDTVLLNSVVQYFPSAEYLAQVLERAIDCLAPGGAVFLGDIRSLPLLARFHLSVELYQAPDALPVEQLRRRLTERGLQENELAVAPAFFHVLAARLNRAHAERPGPRKHVTVEIYPKHGRTCNEMTAFRYQVVLRVEVSGHEGPAQPPCQPDWQAGADLDRVTLRQQLEASARVPRDVVAWTRLPNARVRRETLAARWLRRAASKQTATVADLRRHLDTLEAGGEMAGFEPDELVELGRELGFHVHVGWSHHDAEGHLDVIFQRRTPGESAEVVEQWQRAAARLSVEHTVPRDRLANDPIAGQQARELVPELRNWLGHKLPDAWIPSAFRLFEALPVTANGKLDRTVLQRSVSEGGAICAAERTGGAPETVVEVALAEIWCQLLGVEQVSLQDSFFQLGGHSLLATQLTFRLRERLGVELPLRAVFEAPTLGQLAERLQQVLQSQAGSEGAVEILPASKELDAHVAPLSFAQQRLWFLDRLVPDSASYNIFGPVALRGPLDVQRLQRALRRIVERHATLRTTFPERLRSEAGEPLQQVAARASVARTCVNLPCVDLRSLAPGARDAELQARVSAERHRSFDLGHGPMLRLCLLRLEVEHHVLLLNIHHIAADGWSLMIFFRELGAFYGELAHNARPDTLTPELPVQYTDFARWQRARLTGALRQAELDFWRRQLAGAPPVLPLPLDRPRPSTPSLRGGLVERRLHVGTALAQRCRQLDATPSMLLLAVFAALLQRYGAGADLPIGSAVAGRDRLEVEHLIGFFVNVLVLRLQPSRRASFARLVAQARRVSVEGYAHQELPFEMLVEELSAEDGMERSLGRNPLCQVMFDYLDFPQMPSTTLTAEREGASALRLEAVPGKADTGTAKFDLTLLLARLPTPDGDADAAPTQELTASLEFNLDLFDATTGERLLRHFERLLLGALADPDLPLAELPLLSSGEREQLLRQWLDVPAPRAHALDGLSLPAAVHRRGQESPERIAVVDAVVGGGSSVDRHLSYGELSRRAVGLVHELRSKLGAVPEPVVGLLAGASSDLVIGALASWWAGAAYLPLDPQVPLPRLELAARSVAVVVPSAPHLEPARALVRALGCELVDVSRGPDGRMPERGSRVDVAHSPEAELAYIVTTSGSTGIPKAVAIPHGALRQRIAWHLDAYAVTSADRTVALSAPSFDASVWDLWPSLSAGACLCFAPREIAADPGRLVPWLQARRIDLGFLSTAVAEAVVGESHLLRDPLPLRALLTGGDRLHRGALQHVSRLHKTSLVNHYGPSEATILVTAGSVSETAATEPWDPPLGRPLPDVSLRILDATEAPCPGDLVPIGVPGELWIGGGRDGLARGYLQDPRRTAESFLPDGLSRAPGARLYRSGDLVRWRRGGQLDFLGRTDFQVQLQGVRTEPAEVETALVQHPAVRAAAVVAVVPRAGSDRSVTTHGVSLAAFVTVEPTTPDEPASSRSADTQSLDLRSWLVGRLPRAMVPARVEVLDALPVTRHGKIDRAALSERVDQGSTVEHRPPISTTERQLAELWRELLEAQVPGLDDDFFQLGGHSLLATRLTSRLREGMQLEVPLQALFEYPTLGALAAHLDQVRRDQTRDDVAVPPLIPLPRDVAGLPVEPPPLSYAQRRLWFLSLLPGFSAAYHVGLPSRLEGSLHVAALSRALSAIVARHEVLRTSFRRHDDVNDGEPYQHITVPGRWSLPVVDLRGLNLADTSATDASATETSATDAIASSLAAREAHLAFDLEHGPLLRCVLVRQSAERHLLLLTLHHVIADGWSLSVLRRELETLYSAQYSTLCTADLAEPASLPPVSELLDRLPPLPVHYADYAVWQRGFLEGTDVSTGAISRQLDYWRQQLDGASELELPTDRPRAASAGRRGGIVPLRLPASVTSALGQLGADTGATRFMVLLPLIAAFLGRLNGALAGTPIDISEGRHDVVLGSPVAGRGRREIEDLIGFFVNTLPLRCRMGTPSETTSRQLIVQSRQTVLEAFAHQELPFEKLVDELQLVRDPRRNPLFQVIFALQQAEQMQAPRLEGIDSQPIGLGEATTRFDLELYLTEVETVLAGALVYSRDLFDATTALRWAGQLQTLLSYAAAAPDAPLASLPTMTPAQQQQVTWEWADAGQSLQRESEFPDHLDRIAVVHGDQRLSYRELHRRAALVARHLQSSAVGIGPEQVVGVCMPRTPDLVVAILGVLASGAAYLPLDPAYPEERLRFMQQDAATQLVLHSLQDVDFGADVAFEAECAPGARDFEPWNVADPDHPAYVIYTSGSTGRPKGVVIPRSATAALLAWTRTAFPSEHLRGMLALTSVSFDISVIELLAPLSAGGTVLLVDNALQRAALRAPEEVTLAIVVPSVMNEWLTVGELPPALRTLALGGEALPAALVERVRSRTDAELWNLYGPTEDTTCSTAVRLPAKPSARAPSIGRPLAGGGGDVRLLDGRLRPVAAGEVGEVCLGGAGIARGYLGRPALTAERFVPDPFRALLESRAHGRLYRTGDLGRWRADGGVEFLGRRDHQVKLRGFRIELGEIEAALLEHPDVLEAAALVVTTGSVARLLAWVTPEPSVDKLAVDKLSVDQLAADKLSAVHDELRRRLPAHLVPEQVEALPALPRTASGKLDRRTLALRAAQRAPSPETLRAGGTASDDLERRLASVWADVLELDAAALGVDANFFELGGNSFQMVRLQARLQQELSVEVATLPTGELSLVDLFQAPTIRSLAARLRAPDSGKAVEKGERLADQRKQAHGRLARLSQRRRGS